MIERKLKTTTGHLLVKMPSTLSELTLGQLAQLQDNPQLSDLDAISILSGVEVSQLQNVSSFADFQELGGAISALSNQIRDLYNSDKIPDSVTFVIDGEPVKVNVVRNLSVEPAGAFMTARDIISEEINDCIKLHGEDNWKDNFNPSLNACCHILAHYFYCRATGKPYNEYDAEEFCTQVKTLKVTEALPIAKYFFLNYPNLSKTKPGYFQRLLLYWKKRQAYRLLKSLNISTP